MARGLLFSWIVALVDVVRMGAGALSPLKSCECSHVPLGKFEAEHVQVLPDARLGAGFGHGGVPQLHMPAEDDLGGGPAVFRRARLDNRISQDLTAAQGTPRFGHNA